MFEEYVVGDLHALNLVDYLESSDFVHGGGGWWYGDLSIPPEYVASEKWYMWWHLMMGVSTGIVGIRIGFLPTPSTVRSIRVSHQGSGTWAGVESYDPWYCSYDSTTGSTFISAGECTILKRGTSWTRATFLSECHTRNATNEVHQIQTNDGDASGITWSNVTGLRISTAGLPTSGIPLYGRVELYALAPRNII